MAAKWNGCCAGFANPFLLDDAIRLPLVGFVKHI